MRWSCAASISGRLEPRRPRSTKPIISSSMSVPIARRPRTSCFSRSDSFTRSSLAPLTRVSPDAWLTTTARKGDLVQQRGDLGRATRPGAAGRRGPAASPPGRPREMPPAPAPPARPSARAPPGSRSASGSRPPRAPPRSPGTRRPAPIPNAADEVPGTSSDPGRAAARGLALTACRLHPDRRSPRGEHPLGVVAGRSSARAGRESPISSEAGQHQRALHLGTGDEPGPGAPLPGAWAPARPGEALARRPALLPPSAHPSPAVGPARAHRPAPE